MVLNDITSAYVGSTPVNSIYIGDKKIFPFYDIWQYEQISSNITGFSLTTSPSGSIDINWGDGIQQSINSGSSVSHTFS